MTTLSIARKLVIAVTLGAVAACVAPGITDPSTRGASALRDALDLANLVECPTSEVTSSTAVVTALGGVVSAGGTSVSIPAGALLAPTTVTVTIPASNLMEIDVSVEGVEHFTFELPVTVTLSYARCTRSDIDHAPLTVWYIDAVTKAPLEPMGGVDDKLTRTVTFTTGHLSGYALAD
jgi:hypothetical protein